MSTDAPTTSEKATQKKRTTSLREEVGNIPNLLTFSRIAMIPPVIILMLDGSREANFAATLLFTFAAITDWLDGFLARRMGIESVLGKLLDPIADKLIVLATLVIAAQLQHIPGWFVVLLLSREITISGLRALASTEGLTISVVQTGKYKTAFQMIGLVALLLHDTYRIHFGLGEADIDFNRLGVALLTVAMAFSLFSAIVYFQRFLKVALNR